LLDDKLQQLQRYVPQYLVEKILANRGRLKGERKLVTVLFADIAGYTALGEQLGEEALSRRAGHHHGALARGRIAL
jgi:class 3 adenylate cyclase